MARKPRVTLAYRYELIKQAAERIRTTEAVRFITPVSTIDEDINSLIDSTFEEIQWQSPM